MYRPNGTEADIQQTYRFCYLLAGADIYNIRRGLSVLFIGWIQNTFVQWVGLHLCFAKVDSQSPPIISFLFRPTGFVLFGHYENLSDAHSRFLLGFLR